MTKIDPHADCDLAANAYKPVTCDRCRRSYVCSPSDDLYCAAGSPDHCCLTCLVGDMPVVEAIPIAEVN